MSRPIAKTATQQREVKPLIPSPAAPFFLLLREAFVLRALGHLPRQFKQHQIRPWIS